MRHLKNDRFLRALLREPVDRTPIWIMRQAGRYLPEYRKIRAQVPDFMTLCKTPALACEVTLQPLRRFKLDAAIIFSDILTLIDAMGFDLHFVPGKGPVIGDPLRSTQAIHQLTPSMIGDRLDYVYRAVEQTAATLDGSVPLIGFAGSPWTVACYLIEGASSKAFIKPRACLYKEPKAMHALLDTLADITIIYLNQQIRSGAQALMLFDTWGGLLSTPDYLDFSLRTMKRITQGLIKSSNGRPVPLVIYTKSGGQWLEQIADTGCDAVGIDWTTSVADARHRVSDRVAIQGNMDPAILFSQPERIRAQVKKILSAFDGAPGHVFNLGHGIDKDTSPDAVSTLIKAVHEFPSKEQI